MDFSKFNDATLRTSHRCAKTRLRPWFADPHAMRALRWHMQLRGLL